MVLFWRLAKNPLAFQGYVSVSHAGQIIAYGAMKTVFLDAFPGAFAQLFRVGQEVLE